MDEFIVKGNEKMKFETKQLFNKFQKIFTAEYIASDLKSCNRKSPQYREESFAYMEKMRYDVLGLKENDKITKYITRDGKEQDIENSEIIEEILPIKDTLNLMKDKERLFIIKENQIKKIITIADLYKPPIILFLFGFVTIFEILCMELIKIYYPNESFLDKLSYRRRKLAKKLYKRLVKENKDIDLMYCLEFCDKTTLIKKKEDFKQLFLKTGIKSKRERDKFLNNAQELRNALAHARLEIFGKTWREIVDIIEKIDKLSDIMEEYLLLGK